MTRLRNWSEQPKRPGPKTVSPGFGRCAFDARTQQFTLSGITEVAGHPVADLTLTAVWFPVWGPTVEVSPGEHQPWPNLHAYLVPLDERFPVVRVSPGTNGGPGVAFQLGSAFLPRTTGTQVQAGCGRAVDLACHRQAHDDSTRRARAPGCRGPCGLVADGNRRL